MKNITARRSFVGVLLFYLWLCTATAEAQHSIDSSITDRRSVYFEKFIDRGGEDSDVSEMLKTQGHITLQNRIEDLSKGTGIKIEVPINPDYASLIRMRRIKAKELESLFEGIPDEEKIRLEHADYIVVPEFTTKAEKNHVNVLIFKPKPRGIQFFHQDIIWDSLYEFHFDKLACGVMQKILEQEGREYFCDRQIGFQKIVVRTPDQSPNPEILGKLQMFPIWLKSALIKHMRNTQFQIIQTNQEALITDTETLSGGFSDPDSSLEFAEEHGLDIILSGILLIGDSVDFLCTISRVDYRLNSIQDIGSVVEPLDPEKQLVVSEKLAVEIIDQLSKK